MLHQHKAWTGPFSNTHGSFETANLSTFMWAAVSSKRWGFSRSKTNLKIHTRPCVAPALVCCQKTKSHAITINQPKQNNSYEISDNPSNFYHHLAEIQKTGSFPEKKCQTHRGTSVVSTKPPVFQGRKTWTSRHPRTLKPQVWSKSTVGLVAISASKIFRNGVIDYHEDQFEMIEKLEKKKKRYR